MDISKRPLLFILLFYIVCFLFRAFEYFVLRTDQSIVGEAFLHKLIGIALLVAAVRLCAMHWDEIGFRVKHASRGIGGGLLFGGAMYAIAYGVEIMIPLAAGNSVSMRFYVASYTVASNPVVQDGVLFILICIAGNIINVIMEEGVFRGLFLWGARTKYSFAVACALSAGLFGLWHIAQPVRNVMEGLQTPMGALMTALMLVVTSALGGVQYTLLTRLTGALWFGMAAHFVNNAIVNLLHVVTASGVDELQTVRITIAQTLSFITVLIVFLRKRAATAHRPI